MDEPLLTPAEVARRCRVSTKTVLRAIHSGRLRASRLGERGAYRIRPEDLEIWLDRTATVAESVEPTNGPIIVPMGFRLGGRLVVHDGMGRTR